MGYLLDTNVLSELRRPERIDQRVRSLLDALPAGTIFISVISLMEIEEGVLRIERRDRLQGIVLRNWLDALRARTPNSQILTVDIDMIHVCASLHVPNRRPYGDALIAATALARELTLVTRNVRDFQIPGLSLFNPWDPDGR